MRPLQMHAAAGDAGMEEPSPTVSPSVRLLRTKYRRRLVQEGREGGMISMTQYSLHRQDGGLGPGSYP